MPMKCQSFVGWSRYAAKPHQAARARAVTRDHDRQCVDHRDLRAAWLRAVGLWGMGRLLIGGRRAAASGPAAARTLVKHEDLRDALLFDNDGTLISSLESVYRCWTRWAKEYGITEEDFAAVELHGRPAAEIAADLLPAERVPEALARIEQLEIEDAAGGVVLLPGTRALLESVPADRWAVVTSATGRLAEARLAEVGVRAKHLVSADDITRGKPDPEPFLLGARRLGVDPARLRGLRGRAGRTRRRAARPG